MQVAKYWRNNNLRYRLEGIVQDKVERKPALQTFKLADDKQENQAKDQVVTSKVDVA